VAGRRGDGQSRGCVQVVALNNLRREWRRRLPERTTARPESGRVDVAAGAVPDPELWMVVGLLPARQRTATVLRYVHGLPDAAIGEVMGVSRGTVASTLAAARKNLRRFLSEPAADRIPVPKEETTHG
jgi:DNA-directed RNA polymerase specialized sigma24 family protein